MTTQSTSLRLADNIAREPYLWPGGYLRFAVTDDGGTLCHHCCASERQWIGTTTGSDGWCVVAADVNWEEPWLTCDHCGKRIDAVYGEPDTQDAA